MSVNLLSRIPFFTTLPQEELDRLTSEMEVFNLKPREILFREGDAGEHLYVVVKGHLEILKAPGTADEMILNTIHEGEYIGEMSLITGEPRTASVRAFTEEVVLLSMSRKQLNDLLHRHPELASSMISVLSERLNSTNVATFRDLTEKNHQLQKAFDELKAAQEQLIEKERLERELKVAAEIQLSILPDVLPSHPDFDFGGRILPARQVGGDFYDVFELGDNKLGVLIGDVADKGVPSAIFMARAHALIIAEADHVTPPGEVLRSILPVLKNPLNLLQRFTVYWIQRHVNFPMHGPGMSLRFYWMRTVLCGVWNINRVWRLACGKTLLWTRTVLL